MTETYIISKKSVKLELHIDGKVEVKSLPDDVIGAETVELLAQTYQTSFDAYLERYKDDNLKQVAVRYFQRKGFEFKEKGIKP
jgi:hypothetical protein